VLLVFLHLARLIPFVKSKSNLFGVYRPTPICTEEEISFYENPIRGRDDCMLALITLFERVSGEHRFKDAEVQESKGAIRVNADSWAATRRRVKLMTRP